MAELEKEVKILNIDVELSKKKLKKIGAIYKGEKKQKIFVYDIPTIYYRFCEIRELLKSNNKLIVHTNLSRLNNILVEIEDLAPDNDLKILNKEFKVKSIDDIVNIEINKLVNILYSERVDNIMKRLMINPNKWLRLRQTNEYVSLTLKHVFEKNKSNIQKVMEYEVSVDSLDETNRILESIGISKRSYQEKIRISYVYKDANIEIDIWPMLEPYIEIESKDDDTINEVIKLLDYKNKEIVSLNTEQLYKRKNVNIHELSELIFK